MDVMRIISEVQDLRAQYEQKLAKLQDYFEIEGLIDEINDNESEGGYSKFAQRNLLSTIEGVNTKRVIMVKQAFNDYAYRYHDRETGKTYYRKFINERPMKEIMKLGEKAQYGDIAKKETLIDESVRKGADIPAEKLHISDDIIVAVLNLFRENFRIAKIKIVPYKINFYEDGDFFKAHRDHPEPNLIGTVLIHIAGDTNAFIIDGEAWDANKYNVCMFFTDVVHEVTPVKDFRETMSFKVYQDLVEHDLHSEVDPRENVTTTELANRVPESTFGIVLQNGYTVTDDNYKGVDKEIYDAFISLGRKISVVPVIVRQTTNIGEEDEWRSRDYYYDDIERIRCIDINSKQVSINFDSDKYSDIKDTMVEIERIHIKIYNMKNSPITIGKMPVFYLGKGFKIGEEYQGGVYTGNSYSGCLIDNVYVNKMFVVE